MLTSNSVMFPQTTSLQNPSLLTKRPQPFFSSRAPCLRAKSKPDSSPDIITRLFGAVFGQQALEDKIPFGLKRMEDQDMYELYPATTTDFAEPVEGDDESVALFRPLLAKTRLEKLPLRYANQCIHSVVCKSCNYQCQGRACEGRTRPKLSLFARTGWPTLRTSMAGTPRLSSRAAMAMELR